MQLGFRTDPNLSETIIYDSMPSVMKKNLNSEYLVSTANKYCDLLNAAQDLAVENPEIIPLQDYINKAIDFFDNNNNLDSKPTIGIIRQETWGNRFVPCYFNIDALCQKNRLRTEVYSSKNSLYEDLKKYCNINFAEPVANTKIKRQVVEKILEDNKQRRERFLDDLREELYKWGERNGDWREFERIKNHQELKIQEFCKYFKMLYPIYSFETAFDTLREVFFDGRSLRNFINSAIFFALPKNHAFKAQVFATFLSESKKKRKESFSPNEIYEKLNPIFETTFLNKNITRKECINLFTSFFIHGRSRGKYTIEDENPFGLPTPQKMLDINTNLLELFKFIKK